MFDKLGETLKGLLNPRGPEPESSEPQHITGLMGSTARAHAEKHMKPGAPTDGD